MNQIPKLSIALIVGIGLGWVIGYVHPDRKATRRLERYIERVGHEMEPYSTMTAIYSIKGIQLIAEGMTNDAMKILSYPIAEYYEDYAANPGTNEYRRNMQELIENLGRSNKIVRASLAQNSENDLVPIWLEEIEGYAWMGHHTNNYHDNPNYKGAAPNAASPPR